MPICVSLAELPAPAPDPSWCRRAVSVSLCTSRRAHAGQKRRRAHRRAPGSRASAGRSARASDSRNGAIGSSTGVSSKSRPPSSASSTRAPSHWECRTPGTGAPAWPPPSRAPRTPATIASSSGKPEGRTQPAQDGSARHDLLRDDHDSSSPAMNIRDANAERRCIAGGSRRGFRIRNAGLLTMPERATTSGSRRPPPRGRSRARSADRSTRGRGRARRPAASP